MGEENRPIVVCASDEAFAVHMTVMLKSLIENSSRPVVIYVLEGGIKKDTMAKVERSLENREHELNWIPVDENSIKDLMVSGHIPIQTYYRLLMPHLLPDSIKKVVYLDCDMVVKKDISILWDIPIEEWPLMAVPSARMSSGLFSTEALNLNPEALYFNAGFLVINLEIWRRDGVGDKTIEFIAKNPQHIKYHDQDALNIVLCEKWKPVDFRWNVITPLCVDPSHRAYYRKAKFYDNYRKTIPLDGSITLEEITADPYIIHYAAGEKPWHHYCPLPYTDEYLYYLDMTAWRGLRMTFLQQEMMHLNQLKKMYGDSACYPRYLIEKAISFKYFLGAQLRRLGLRG